MQQQDWMSFLASFIDQCKLMGAKYEAREMTQAQINEVANELFIEAHAFQEPKLHQAMQTAWAHIQDAMETIKLEQNGEGLLTKVDLFRKHMVELFVDPRKVVHSRIPLGTRAYYMYYHDLNLGHGYFH